MEVWLAINSGLLGGVISWTILDILHRHKTIKTLLETKEDFDDKMSKIQAVHNELAQKIIDMDDKVGRHDFQLNSRIKTK